MDQTEKKPKKKAPEPIDPRLVLPDQSRKPITSCYEYPLRSFMRHKKAYLLLAASILCMVILSTSVLIFYASRYEAEVEGMRREYGPQHTEFLGIDPDAVPSYTAQPYIRDSLVLDRFASAENPDIMSSFENVFFTRYSEKADDFFYLDIVKGSYPEKFGDILVSEAAERYFPCFTAGETQDVTVLVHGVLRTISFRVCGVFRSSESAEPYIFCGDETADYMLGSADGEKKPYVSDVYLIFKGNTPTAIKRGMQKLIAALGLVKVNDEGEIIDINYIERNEMLSEHALVDPYYEGSSMQLMFLFSIVPAVIALVVFIYLDMQKNLSELASLTMIGTTWKQIFRMQLLKYFLIFCAIFPFGALGAALLMRTVCSLTNRISPDKIFLWYRFDIAAVIFLFLLCAGMLTLIIYFLSKRLTSVAYSEMLSASHRSGDIMVSRTSDLLFTEGNAVRKMGILFFTRNRRVNFLYCAVMVLLICVYAFFTMQTAKEYGAAPDASVMEQTDFLLYGDTGVSDVFDTMDPELYDLLQTIPGVESVSREFRITPFFSDFYDIRVITYIAKQMVSNTVKSGSFGKKDSYRVNKRGELTTRLIGSDPDLLASAYAKDVVAGDLSSLYEDPETVAIVVNAWAGNNPKYYQIGDTVPITYLGLDLSQISEEDLIYEPSEGEDPIELPMVQYGPWKYKIGAIIYRPDDDPYERIVTVCCSPETFLDITGITDVYSYSVRCTDDTDETLSGVASALAGLEHEHIFTVTDTHEELRQAKARAVHTVLYVYLMKVFVLLVTLLLIIAMTRFMLEVRAPSLRAMSMLGAEKKQLIRMTSLEFLIAAVVSSVIGLLVSVIGTWIIAVRFEIKFFFTPVTTLLIIFSVLMLTAVYILVPAWITSRTIGEHSR